MTFEISKEQEERLIEWKALKKGKERSSNVAIGGAYTYCFTPTSIGTFIVVKYVDGTQIELTDEL